MRSLRVVFHTFVVLGSIAAFAATAHAGGGQGGGVNILEAFQCYLIFADAPPPGNNVVNLTDQFGTRENVRIGGARLVCTPTQATKPEGSTDFTFDPLPEGADHIKCYQISPVERNERSRPTFVDPDAVVDLTDELDTVRGVKVSVPAFLCTLARKDCVSGANCPTPPPAE